MQMSIIDENELLVMKFIHYFIINEDYTPVVIKGINDEVWLENRNNSYSIIRIVTKHIHNKEQFDYDVLKTKHIAKQIKRKTFDFSMNVLSIYTDINIEEVNDEFESKYDNVVVKNDEEFINNKFINKAFKKVKENYNYKEEGFDLISKITSEIGNKNEE